MKESVGGDTGERYENDNKGEAGGKWSTGGIQERPLDYVFSPRASSFRIFSVCVF